MRSSLWSKLWDLIAAACNRTWCHCKVLQRSIWCSNYFCPLNPKFLFSCDFRSLFFVISDLLFWLKFFCSDFRRSLSWLNAKSPPPPAPPSSSPCPLSFSERIDSHHACVESRIEGRCSLSHSYRAPSPQPLQQRQEHGQCQLPHGSSSLKWR